MIDCYRGIYETLFIQFVTNTLVISGIFVIVCYAVIFIQLSVLLFTNTMFIHIRTKTCFCGGLVSTILLLIYVYVILQVVGGLHVFLHISVEYTSYFKYKFRKIQKIWVVGE